MFACLLNRGFPFGFLPVHYYFLSAGKKRAMSLKSGSSPAASMMAWACQAQNTSSAPQ